MNQRTIAARPSGRASGTAQLVNNSPPKLADLESTTKMANFDSIPADNYFKSAQHNSKFARALRARVILDPLDVQFRDVRGHKSNALVREWSDQMRTTRSFNGLSVGSSGPLPEPPRNQPGTNPIPTRNRPAKSAGSGLVPGWFRSDSGKGPEDPNPGCT